MLWERMDCFCKRKSRSKNKKMEDFDQKERKLPEENRKGLVTSRKENRILSYLSLRVHHLEMCVERKGSCRELEKKSHMIMLFSSIFSGRKMTFCSVEEDKTG